MSTNESPDDGLRQSAYTEAAANYRLFLGWRDRIFAGYLAVVAAIVAASLQYPHAALPMGPALVLASIVCVILDVRTLDLVADTQATAAAMELGGQGPFTTLEQRRYGAPRPWSIRSFLYSWDHGCAVHLTIAVGAAYGVYVSSLTAPPVTLAIAGGLMVTALTRLAGCIPIPVAGAVVYLALRALYSSVHAAQFNRSAEIRRQLRPPA